MELKKTLKAELKSRGYPITDKPGYLYAEGTIHVLLVAHMDTVHRQPVEQICYSADGAVDMSLHEPPAVSNPNEVTKSSNSGLSQR